jgi:RimJ/RimL family protein N-acetyltransferase
VVGHPRGLTPQPIVDAGSLRLRPFDAEDVDWVHRTSLDPELARYVDIPAPYERRHAEFFVRQMAIEGWSRGQRAEFVVADAATADRVGRVGFGLDGRGGAEIGYWSDPRSRGRGLMTAAVIAACRWVFTDRGLDLIQWRTEVGNLASRRVAEKAGFRIEATLRLRSRHRGSRVDVWVGSMLPGELAVSSP